MFFGMLVAVSLGTAIGWGFAYVLLKSRIHMHEHALVELMDLINTTDGVVGDDGEQYEWADLKNELPAFMDATSEMSMGRFIIK